ncbi:ABC-type sugar transport system, periplasmic component [Anaerolinea thermolimosa]|uniref:ABC transporter substrate-binding protein n=1 Tax=Anaerolinea thermolimosa TaxID=229919 RepID=UPI0007815052|nr:extracellular solute-binding protein [Anaerolinea thermolimosa]GAP05188.1 ABC-type sugar transport system, periplasmic component [Anaerolinea thermolimosa]
MPASQISRRSFLRNTVLVTGAAAMVACAPQATTASQEAPTARSEVTGPVKITFMSWGGVERFQKWIDAWNGTWPDAAKKIVPEAVTGGSGSSDMFTMLRTAMAAGGENIPDFYESNATDIPEFAERGLMLPIDDYLTPYTDDLIPAAKKVASYNGHFYGVPMQVKSKVWWYRKDMFEKAGIVPDQVKTLDDLINAGKALKGAYPDAFLFNLAPKSSGGWLSMLLSYYDDLKFAERGGTWNVTTDERFAQMFDIVKKIYKADIASPVGDWSSDWSPAMTDSKIASIIGPSGASWMAEFLPQFDTVHAGLWGAALWPEFSREGSEAGGSIWAITKYSKNPGAAFEYLKNFHLTKEGALTLYKLIGFLPMIKSAQEIVKAEAAKNERPEGTTEEQWKLAPVNYFGLDYLDVLFQAQDHVKIFQYDMAFNNEINILGQYCNEYVEDKMTLLEALRSAEDEMKTQIVDPYKLG